MHFRVCVRPELCTPCPIERKQSPPLPPPTPPKAAQSAMHCGCCCCCWRPQASVSKARQPAASAHHVPTNALIPPPGRPAQSRQRIITSSHPKSQTQHKPTRGAILLHLYTAHPEYNTRLHVVSLQPTCPKSKATHPTPRRVSFSPTCLLPDHLAELCAGSMHYGTEFFQHHFYL